jgi:hypothetical protein
VMLYSLLSAGLALENTCEFLLSKAPSDISYYSFVIEPRSAMPLLDSYRTLASKRALLQGAL